MNHPLTTPALLRNSVDLYADRPALSWEDGQPYTYAQVMELTKSLAARLVSSGVLPGDRVAVLAHNMPAWGIVNFGIHLAGGVMVPLLPDFHSREIANILEHSGSKVLVLSDSLKQKLGEINGGFQGEIIRMDDLDQVEPSEINDWPEVKPDDLACIIYTSGTTGNSKGVMLTHANLVTNVYQGYALQKINRDDRFLSLLPLSHTLENTLSLLLPIARGASVYYLRKPPTPAVLLPALQRVKPTTILSVPLIIEKIYRNKVMPTFTRTALLRALYAR
ncbi:MAG: AMP-binding protein, partial [Bacteroidales bacterium]|nr:AMP-binding protein [Bacteroidales bacterium]